MDPAQPAKHLTFKTQSTKEFLWHWFREDRMFWYTEALRTGPPAPQSVLGKCQLFWTEEIEQISKNHDALDVMIFKGKALSSTIGYN